MTITKTLAKLPGAVTDNNVDIAVIAQSDLKYQRTEKSTDGLSTTQFYILATGDPSQEVSVTVRLAFDGPKVTQRKRRLTIKLVTSQLIADSVAGTTVLGDSVESFIGWAVPMDGSVVVADLRMLLSSMYGLTFDAVTSGVPSNALLTKASFNVSTLYGVA
jgi:hypothetical protein